MFYHVWNSIDDSLSSKHRPACGSQEQSNGKAKWFLQNISIGYTWRHHEEMYLVLKETWIRFEYLGYCSLANIYLVRTEEQFRAVNTSDILSPHHNVRCPLDSLPPVNPHLSSQLLWTEDSGIYSLGWLDSTALASSCLNGYWRVHVT